MIMRATACLALVLALVAISPAEAAPVPAAGPFTEAELNRFLADWPAYAHWSYKSFDYYRTRRGPDAWRYMGSREEKAFLAGRGWATPERFFYILSHINVALRGAGPARSGPGSLSELEAQRDKIRESPMIPDIAKMIATMGIDIALAIQSDLAGGNTKATLEAIREEIRRNPQIPPEAKRQAMDGLDRALAETKAQDRLVTDVLPASELDLIEKRRADIVRVLRFIP